MLKEIDVSQELEKSLAECEEKAKALQTTLEEREEELEAVVGDKQAKINTENNCSNFPACTDLKVKIQIWQLK